MCACVHGATIWRGAKRSLCTLAHGPLTYGGHSLLSCKNAQSQPCVAFYLRRKHPWGPRRFLLIGPPPLRDGGRDHCDRAIALRGYGRHLGAETQGSQKHTIWGTDFPGVSEVNMAIGVDAAIRPSDLLTTRALLPRPKRPPDLQAQLAAFCELSVALANDPRAAIRRFLEVAIRLCGAGSAGLSVLRSNQAGQAIIRWEAVSGALASHEGVDTPRDSSPCGLCLDAGATVLIGQPERAFAYLRNTPPSILEDLIVPLHDHANKTLGTLWIAHHDASSRFSSDDARILEQLATQLVLALKLRDQSRENRSHWRASNRSNWRTATFLITISPVNGVCANKPKRRKEKSGDC